MKTTLSAVLAAVGIQDKSCKATSFMKISKRDFARFQNYVLNVDNLQVGI